MSDVEWREMASVNEGSWRAHIKSLFPREGERPVLEVEAITRGCHPNAKLLGHVEPAGHALLTWTPDQFPISGSGRHGTRYRNEIDGLYRPTVENALRHAWLLLGHRPSVRIVGAGPTLEPAEAAVAMGAAALAIAVHSEEAGALDVDSIREVLRRRPWEALPRTGTS